MNGEYLTAEARARLRIDGRLAEAGWAVQDRTAMNLYAGPGVAVREFIMAQGHGRADYLLFVDGIAVGAVEAKPAGTPLAGVEPQSAKYSTGLPAELPSVVRPLPFRYEATGDETMFTDLFDPDPRARSVFAFHRPATLARWVRRWQIDEQGVRTEAGVGPGLAGTRRSGSDAAKSSQQSPGAGSFRARLPRLGPVPADGLRRIQVKAIGAVEASMLANRPRALAQMAALHNTRTRLTRHACANPS